MNVLGVQCESNVTVYVVLNSIQLAHSLHVHPVSLWLVTCHNYRGGQCKPYTSKRRSGSNQIHPLVTYLYHAHDLPTLLPHTPHTIALYIPQTSLSLYHNRGVLH
jgi:hypothetical protein